MAARLTQAGSAAVSCDRQTTRFVFYGSVLETGHDGLALKVMRAQPPPERLVADLHSGGITPQVMRSSPAVPSIELLL
jgi:hypothetical protein